jgi:hypothetical protein
MRIGREERMVVLDGSSDGRGRGTVYELRESLIVTDGVCRIDA